MMRDGAPLSYLSNSANPGCLVISLGVINTFASFGSVYPGLSRGVINMYVCEPTAKSTMNSMAGSSGVAGTKITGLWPG